MFSYDLQQFIRENVEEQFDRDFRYSFFDITNYYTKKDFAVPNEIYRQRAKNLVEGPALVQKGLSKENRLTPIVQTSLFMDRYVISQVLTSGPISWSVLSRW